ncbi:hypothetical protein BDQ12DRAFT_683322, partial [Crucibulum laeve]
MIPPRLSVALPLLITLSSASCHSLRLRSGTHAMSSPYLKRSWTQRLTHFPLCIPNRKNVSADLSCHHLSMSPFNLESVSEFFYLGCPACSEPASTGAHLSHMSIHPPSLF